MCSKLQILGLSPELADVVALIPTKDALRVAMALVFHNFTSANAIITIHPDNIDTTLTHTHVSSRETTS